MDEWLGNVACGSLYVCGGDHLVLVRHLMSSVAATTVVGRNRREWDIRSHVTGPYVSVCESVSPKRTSPVG